MSDAGKFWNIQTRVENIFSHLPKLKVAGSNPVSRSSKYISRKAGNYWPLSFTVLFVVEPRA